MSFNEFFVFLLVCVLVMGASIWMIFRQLKVMRAREEKVREGEERVAKERQSRIESIQILLKTVGSEELGWIETSIRVKNLLDQLGMDLSDHQEIGAFYDITAKTEHIPTHDQWNTLPQTARSKYRKEMQQYEAEYLERLQRAKNALLAHSFA